MIKNYFSKLFILSVFAFPSVSWGQVANCTIVRNHLDNGNIARANQLIDTILQKEPCNSEALALRGRILAAQNNLPLAIENYDRARSCKKALPRDNILEIATAYSLTDRHQEAAELLQEYLKDHSQDVEFLHELGLTYLSLDQIDAACHSLEKGLQLAPNDFELATDFGSCLIYAGKIEEALTFLKMVTTNNPREPLPHVFLGDAYVVKKDMEQALKAYNSALQLDANHPLAHYRRGRLNQERMDYKAAEEDFKRLLNNREFQGKAIQALLETSMAAGNLEQAQKWLQVARKYEVHSQVKSAIYQAEIFRLQGNNQAAKKVLLGLIEKERAPAIAWKVLLAIGEEEQDKELIKRAKKALDNLSKRH